MKSCPRCGKEYPDSESFCETDGTALVAVGDANPSAAESGDDNESAAPPSASVIECPVCGGKAQPGEVICNFCGTRLVADAGTGAGTVAAPPVAAAAHGTQEFIRSGAHQGPVEIGTPQTDQFVEESNSGRRAVGVLGFALAAIVALAAGAWFAIYLTGKRPAPPAPVAAASPSPAAVSGPIVTLAQKIPIQIQGDLAGALLRDKKSLRKVFEDNRATLADVYKHALDSDASLRDGMIVRLHIGPDGSVANASVRVSTSPNPSLDAEAVKAMTAWKFAPAKGTGVDADYPVVFATASSDIAPIEADLNIKLASLGPNEVAEYAFSPSAAPTEAAATSIATPAIAAAPVEAPPAAAVPESMPTPARRKRPRMLASVRPPEHMRKPPLVDRVMAELRANRKLRRVQAYTNGGTVNLSGKVFDDNDKLLAERTVRGVDGVSGVVDNLTTDKQEWAQKQARISQELQNAGLTGVTVKVIGSDAYLNGEVKTDLDRQRAVTIAQAAAPVKVRENLIRVAPGS